MGIVELFLLQTMFLLLTLYGPCLPELNTMDKQRAGMRLLVIGLKNGYKERIFTRNIF